MIAAFRRNVRLRPGTCGGQVGLDVSWFFLFKEGTSFLTGEINYDKKFYYGNRWRQWPFH
jgi:hypothetical protein